MGKDGKGRHVKARGLHPLSVGKKGGKGIDEKLSPEKQYSVIKEYKFPLRNSIILYLKFFSSLSFDRVTLVVLLASGMLLL